MWSLENTMTPPHCMNNTKTKAETGLFPFYIFLSFFCFHSSFLPLSLSALSSLFLSPFIPSFYSPPLHPLSLSFSLTLSVLSLFLSLTWQSTHMSLNFPAANLFLIVCKVSKMFYLNMRRNQSD